MSNIFNPPQGAHIDASGKIVETPPAEQSPAETSPNTAPEGTTEKAAEGTKESAPAPAAPAPVEIDWATVLNEKTGGKYKTWEEITAGLSHANSEPVFSNDDSKKIFQYLKEGKVDDVLQVYNEQKRLSTLKDMTDADVVKLAMEYKRMGLTPAEIHEEFLNAYSIEKPEEPNADDYLDDDALAKAKKVYDRDLKRYEKDVKTLERKLKQEAAESRSYLETLKKDIILPDIEAAPVEAQDNGAEQATRRAEEEKFRTEYLSSLDKSFGDFKEIPITVTDEGVSFTGKFEIAEAERQQLKKDLAEKDVVNEILVPRYVKEDGFDTKQLMEDIYLLNNKDKILASFAKQAMAYAKLERIKQQKNVDFDGGHRENFTPSEEQAMKEFSSSFLKAR